jgi:hypothetical protein
MSRKLLIEELEALRCTKQPCHSKAHSAGNNVLDKAIDIVRQHQAVPESLKLCLLQAMDANNLFAQTPSHVRVLAAEMLADAASKHQASPDVVSIQRKSLEGLLHMAQHCHSSDIAGDFDFSTPLDDARIALAGEFASLAGDATGREAVDAGSEGLNTSPAPTKSGAP